MAISANSDYGRRKVDEQLDVLESRLSTMYSKAGKEVTSDLNIFLAKYQKQDILKREQLQRQEITSDQYIDWRERQIFRSDLMRAKIEDLSKKMVNADKEAMAMVNGELPQAYATSYNWGGFRGEKTAQAAGFDYTTFDIVNADAVKTLAKEDPDLIPWKPMPDEDKDKAWNRRHIQDAIHQGIVQGDSMDKIAQRLLPVVHMDQNAAIRTARTAITSVENKGRKDATERVREAGIPMVEVWSCTHDSRTRDTHILLDGTEPNEQGLYGEGILSTLLRYPADPQGDPEEVYNCRCGLLSTIKGIDHTKDNELYEQFMSDNYEEDWEKVKEQRQEKEQAFREKKEIAEQKFGIREAESGKDSRSIIGLEPPQRPRQADYGGYTDEYIEARDAYRIEREEYERKIEEAKQAALDRTAFTTKEEVQNWAKDQNITIADPRVLDDVDIRAFNDVKPALEEMFERYPEVKEYYIELEDGSLFKTSFAMGIDDHCLMSANRGLNFSLNSFEDYSAALSYGLEGMAEGHFVKGDGTFETLVRHEYGHRTQDFLEASLSHKYHNMVTDWRKDFNTFEEKKASLDEYHKKRDAMDKELVALAKLKGASEYSQTNSLELFAEGFAEYTSGSQTEFGIAFGKYLEKWWEICT